MPELPEVERGRQIAEAALGGHRLASVTCAEDPIVFDKCSAHDFEQALLGRRVNRVRRWGKQLWFELDHSPHPLFHFGMTGAFRTPDDTPLNLKAGPNEDTAVWPPRFWKIRLVNDQGDELVMTDARRLGRILLRAEPENEFPISRLGFDPLLSMPTPSQFEALLRGRKSILKGLLLDQSFCAGIGNWIADEVLYQSGIDPRRRVDTLSSTEIRRLRSKLKSIVARAVAANANDSQYPRRWLFHRRWGKNQAATTHDHKSVSFMSVAGRTTAWVPEAQT